MKLITTEKQLRAHLPNMIATVKGEVPFIDRLASYLTTAEEWAIQDLMPVNAAISRISTGSVQITFFLFLALFTLLLIAEIGIMFRAIKKGPEE